MCYYFSCFIICYFTYNLYIIIYLCLIIIVLLFVTYIYFMYTHITIYYYCIIIILVQYILTLYIIFNHYYSCLVYFNFTHYFYYYYYYFYFYYYYYTHILFWFRIFTSFYCIWRYWDLNPGLPGRQPRSLPLSYLGSLLNRCEFFSIYDRLFASFVSE